MRFMKGTRIQRVLAGREGQLSLVLLLVVAIALIFFAVTLNWARISSMKTMTTVASNVGAAKLASYLASYGENPVQSSLEGKRKKCAWSGLFAKLLLVIIIVAILIMAIFCQACSVFLAKFAITWVTAVIALAAAGLALVLQATVVEPGISGMWNKLQQNIPRIEDQFAESAIQMALERVVSDQEKVNDISDYDMNGKWCQTSVPSENCQKISRFAYYYVKRLMGVQVVSTALLDAYKAYRTALGTYVGDDLGVVTKRTDLTSTTNPKPYVYDIDDTCCLAMQAYPLRTQVNPQYCNACCITIPLREPACGVGGQTITSSVTVDDLLYGGGDPLPIPLECGDGPYQGDYPLSYDPLFCMRFAYQKSGYNPPNYSIPAAIPPNTNSPYSLVTDQNWTTSAYVAVMGVDDSVPTWSRLRDLKPNWPDLWKTQYNDVDGPHTPQFRGKDSEGRFFPFLWFMRDTQVKIKGVTYTAADYGTPACHWCRVTAQCKADAITNELYWGCDPLINPTCSSSPSLGYDISVYNPASPANPAPTAPAGDDLQCVNFFEGFVGSRDDACRLDPSAICGTEKFSISGADREVDNVGPLWDYLAGAVRELEENGTVYGCPGVVDPSAAPPAGCTAGCPCDTPGKWRTGNDRFCSADVASPYFSGNFGMNNMCEKFRDPGIVGEMCVNSAASAQPDTLAGEPEISDYSPGPGPLTYLQDICSCQSVQNPVTKTKWRDDEFDLTIQKMSDLANSTRLILMDRGENYYKEVDQWGQRAQRWSADIRYITQKLYGYKAAIAGWPNAGYPPAGLGNTCYTSAWCVPTRGDIATELTQSQDERTFVAVSPDELQTIGAGTAALLAAASYGSPRQVTTCLQYNAGNQAYFDGLAGQYEAPMAAKRAYMDCAYPTTLDGYEKVGGTEDTCYNSSGAATLDICCPYPRAISATPCVPTCGGWCGVPAIPLVPKLIDGQCGVGCGKPGTITKRPAPPAPPCPPAPAICPPPPAECFVCGAPDCPASTTPVCTDGTDRPCFTCPASCINGCPGPNVFCSNATGPCQCPVGCTGGCPGPNVVCSGTGVCGSLIDPCTGTCGPDPACVLCTGTCKPEPSCNPCPASCINGCPGPNICSDSSGPCQCPAGCAGGCPGPNVVCSGTGVCGSLTDPCTGTCGPDPACVLCTGTCAPDPVCDICPVACAPDTDVCDSGEPCGLTCPVYCEAGGAEVAPLPDGPYPGVCNYTSDCSGLPQNFWDNAKQAAANAFCQAKQGTNADPVPPPPANPTCAVRAEPPAWDGFLGFRRTLERDWHRTLSTKALYAPVDTPVPLGESSASVGAFSLFYFTSPLPSDPDTVRGWDTDGLVGNLMDECTDFYGQCSPLRLTPWEASAPGADSDSQLCEDAALMCVKDPVFVYRFLPDSSLLAARQVPKLNKRRDYLNMLISQAVALAGALPADGPLAPFRQHTAAVQTTLDALIALNETEKAKPPDLPNWAIYVWQSAPPPGETQGYWHAVKVEALLPRRCFVNGDQSNMGVPDFDGFDCCQSGENKGKFPWIRTYNTNWGMRRCYEMWDEEGCVKVRVSRYDEDHTFGNSVIKFLNGVPLWRFLYRHPMHSGDARVLPSADICSDAAAYGAFITYPGAPNAATCAPKAEELIQQGYVSETCARYQLDPENPNDTDGRWTYNLVFRDCRSCCFTRPRFHKLADN
jgi:hypothetical protein